MARFMDRRMVLRGTLGGCAITVGVPLLECALNVGGTALADGRPIPTRFGTWFWGLGTNKEHSTPLKLGPDFDLRGELEPLAAVKQHINYFSHYTCNTDGRPNFVHHSGAGLLRCGQAPSDSKALPSETIDVTISDLIGGASRFPSLEMTATGDRSHSYSARGPSAVNPPEASAVGLYKLVFGPEFQDPNAATFTPNPDLMLKQSVLSAVREDSRRLEQTLGAADRARLDEYYTSIRAAENRLALMLQKPPPAEACYQPKAPREAPEGTNWDLVAERHDAMSDILVAALACNQTRVFNMVYSWSGANTTKQGLSTNHHTLTHEEPKNAEGYQSMHGWFVQRAMESWGRFVGKLAAVKEGDGTLLDHTLVYAHSEHDTAQSHSLDGIPMMTAGRAGGRLRTGIHVSGKEEKPATQLGLTLLRAMGSSEVGWGRGSMKTTEVVGEILA
jgi:hypothetical protein